MVNIHHFYHYLIIKACTGIDDVGIAIAHLEEANWTLVVSTYYNISGIKFERSNASNCDGG